MIFFRVPNWKHEVHIARIMFIRKKYIYLKVKKKKKKIWT